MTNCNVPKRLTKCFDLSLPAQLSIYNITIIVTCCHLSCTSQLSILYIDYNLLVPYYGKNFMAYYGKQSINMGLQNNKFVNKKFDSLRLFTTQKTQ